MQAIKLEITQYIDNDFPGFIKGNFFDIHGVQHIFHEKVPVVTLLDLDESSEYPQEGIIACEIVQEHLAANGRKIYQVDSANPFSIETIEGNTQFEIFEEQLVLF